MLTPRQSNASCRQLSTETGDDMAAECRQVAYSVIKDRLPPDWTLDFFAEKSACFNFLPVTVAGECVGAIIFSGHEVHAAIRQDARGRWFGKRVSRWLRDRLNSYGKLTTKVMNGYRMGHEFADRLGFVVCGANESVTFYERKAA